ncbi:MAG: hypothetical protein ACRDZ6_11930 [Acidimicrobiales bacterium]
MPEALAARAAALALLAACTPGRPTGDPLLSPTAACWTPLSDWETGPVDGLAALRRAAAAVLAAAVESNELIPSAVVASDELAVVEVELPRDDRRPADAPGDSAGSVSLTLLVVVRDGLVHEARCYFDPEAAPAASDKESPARRQ